MPRGFTYPRTIHLSDTDAVGIFYFARFYDLAHEALEECLHERGLTIHQILSEEEYLCPITHSSCDYKKPLRVGERVCDRSGNPLPSTRTPFRRPSREAKQPLLGVQVLCYS